MEVALGFEPEAPECLFTILVTRLLRPPLFNKKFIIFITTHGINYLIIKYSWEDPSKNSDLLNKQTKRCGENPDNNMSAYTPAPSTSRT